MLEVMYCGTKDCLILDVRISSLEVDLHVPGNRDEFPFSLQSRPASKRYTTKAFYGPLVFELIEIKYMWQ